MAFPQAEIANLLLLRECEGREPFAKTCQTAVQTAALGKNCDGVRTKGTYPLQFLPRNAVSTVVSQCLKSDFAVGYLVAVILEVQLDSIARVLEPFELARSYARARIRGRFLLHQYPVQIYRERGVLYQVVAVEYRGVVLYVVCLPRFGLERRIDIRRVNSIYRTAFVPVARSSERV